VSKAAEPFSGRIIEIIAVLVLGITTMGTAWCSYEAFQWNGQQTDLSQEASNEQVEASRLFGLATQKISYDSSLLGQYAVAYRAGDEKLMQFYRTSLMRPDLIPFLDAWVAQVKAGQTPANLLSDPSYTNEVLADYTAASTRSADLERQSTEAGLVANRYLVTTILLAVGLFFGGVTTSFRWPAAKVAMIALAVIAVALAATRLVDLPIRL
jgi:hypothetical protein